MIYSYHKTAAFCITIIMIEIQQKQNAHSQANGTFKQNRYYYSKNQVVPNVCWLLSDSTTMLYYICRNNVQTPSHKLLSIHTHCLVTRWILMYQFNSLRLCHKQAIHRPTSKAHLLQICNQSTRGSQIRYIHKC